MSSAGEASRRIAGRGYSYLHHAVDDYSGLVYSETLADEKKDTAAGFMRRACQFFTEQGIDVTRVITDIRSLLPFHGVQRCPGCD